MIQRLEGSVKRVIHRGIMMKRRSLIKGALLTSTTMLAGVPLAFGQPFVARDNPTALALKYVEDAEKAERPDKLGVAGKDQICANCRFYRDPTADAAGCSLFANQLVPAAAWCAGWVPIS